MKNYVKPVVLSNDELAEGVYAASGAGGGDCYVVTPYIHQRPEEGSGDYRIQVNCMHQAVDGHHSTAQVLVIYFNQPVQFVGVNGADGVLAGGDGTSALTINYSLHNNAYENFGLGDVIVNSEAGLTVTGAVLRCNYTCDQHDM